MSFPAPKPLCDQLLPEGQNFDVLIEIPVSKCPFVSRLQELRSDSGSVAGSSGGGTPQLVSSSVRILAQALSHIEQGIERRFIKAPLGESWMMLPVYVLCLVCRERCYMSHVFTGDEDSKKDPKPKKNKRKDEDQASDGRMSF